MKIPKTIIFFILFFCITFHIYSQCESNNFYKIELTINQETRFLIDKKEIKFSNKDTSFTLKSENIDRDLLFDIQSYMISNLGELNKSIDSTIIHSILRKDNLDSTLFRIMPHHYAGYYIVVYKNRSRLNSMVVKTDNRTALILIYKILNLCPDFEKYKHDYFQIFYWDKNYLIY